MRIAEQDDDRLTESAVEVVSGSEAGGESGIGERRKICCAAGSS